MRQHKLAGVVTRKLEKQDWYQKAEMDDLPPEEYETEVEEIMGEAEIEEAPVEVVAEEPEKKTEGESEDDGLDFGIN